MNASFGALAAIFTSILMAPVMTGAADDLAACAVTSRSEGVVLMHCITDGGDKAWVEAAKAVCKPGKVCNVWIWEDPSKMPALAPKTDAELPKSATAAAVAVWINDAGSLVKLKKVK